MSELIVVTRDEIDAVLEMFARDAGIDLDEDLADAYPDLVEILTGAVSVWSVVFALFGSTPRELITAVIDGLLSAINSAREQADLGGDDG